MALSWMVKYAAKAKLSAQKEYVCIREEFQWERDMWMLSSALTSVWQEKQKQERMKWRYWLAIFFLQLVGWEKKSKSHMCAKDHF